MAKKSNFAKYIKEKEINDKKQEIAKAKAQMKKKASAEKAKALKEKEAEENRALEGGEAADNSPQTDSKNVGANPNPEKALPKNFGKSTSLVFFRQYNTYQALLDVRPGNGLSIDGCFSKVVLSIMTWFKSRLKEDAFEDFPQISFLRDEYPEPENFEEFHIENTKNINGLDFIDLETAYLPNKNAWLYRLMEPDNGNERKDIKGRVFTTEIMVYKLKKAVVLGIRESCREPRTNTEDASVYRPSFVRKMFGDADLTLSEYGLKPEYAFDVKPVFLNGKSVKDCERIVRDLIASECRQMPVIFVPEAFYNEHAAKVDATTDSLLGFGHVVVWQNSAWKLFAQVMENEELAEVAAEGQIIVYRTNYLMEYPAEYYEADEESVLDRINAKMHKEPLRKLCDYKEFEFKPSWWEVSRSDGHGSDASDLDLKEAYENEIDRLKQQIRERDRDIDELKTENESLRKETDDLHDEISRDAIALSKKNENIENLEDKIDDLKEKNRELEGKLTKRVLEVVGLKESEKERYTPLINLPSFGPDKAAEFIGWIRKYYPEELIVLPSAEKSLADDKRNVDYHRLCMMIHYLAGYTKNRNAGGLALDPLVARDYDPEEAAYKVTPVSSGAMGATEMHKSKYTVVYKGADGKKQEGLLDLHIKYGKGGDSNMIRIYFHYSPELGKSIIGYLPGHLPTSKDGH